MKNSEVPMMALRRAVQICGGLDVLGDKLNTSTDTLERMINGAYQQSIVPPEDHDQWLGRVLRERRADVDSRL